MERAIEALRLIRVPPAGKLMIQIGHKRYAQVSEIADAQARQIVLAAIGELIVAAGGYQTIVDAGFAPPVVAPSSAPTTRTPAEAPRKPPNTLLGEDTFLESLEQRAIDPPPPATINNMPSTFWAPLRNRRGRTPESPAGPSPLDIPRQINEIVQRRLRDEPELSRRTIRIESDRIGGLRIIVDEHIYSDAVQIEDPLVRFVIRMSIDEWERDNKR